MNDTVNIKVTDDILLPVFGSKGAAAFDLKCGSDVMVRPGQVVKIGTGVSMEVPEGYGLLILPRSSTQFDLWNTVGLVDSDYRGEIFLKIKNKTDEVLFFDKGDRIVQGILVPCLKPRFVKVNKLSTTERGDGGFGSTGVK